MSSKILETQLIAHILHNPEVIEKTTLRGDQFSDVTSRVIYTKLKHKYEESNNTDFINQDYLSIIFENNQDLLNSQGIESFNHFGNHIFKNYNNESFDWMFGENIIKEEDKKRKYQEIFEKAQEEIVDVGIDTALSNLDMGLRKLDKHSERDSSIIQANSFMELYNQKTKEIEELKNSNKPTYYQASHPILAKYGRIKKGWFCNIISGCVDMDTEFFNGERWKKISEYKDGDKVLQYNLDGTSELVLPSEYHKYESEYLTHFKTKYGIDQCLSDEHNVVYFTEDSNNIKKKLFSEIKKRHNFNKTGFRGKFKLSSNFKGGSGISLTDDEIRLMVAVKADGSYPNKSNSCRINLKKYGKKNILEGILKSCGIKFSKTSGSQEGYHVYYFKAPEKSKVFSSEWYNCSRAQLNVIADTVLKFDGCIDTSSSSTVGRFHSTIKENADFIQFVFSSLDYRASIHTKDRRGRIRTINGKKYITKSIDYDVYISKNNLTSIRKGMGESKVSLNPYKTKDGFKYCFTVDSGMLVLRRNNNIFITGNSGGGKSLGLIQECVHHSKAYNERCLFITDENSDEVILTYMYCNYLGFKYHDIEDRNVDLHQYIESMKPEDKKELERVFTNIDVIELPGIPTLEVRNILKNAQNNDNPYGWLGIDSFEELNIDSNLEEISRQNQNAILCERIAKDFGLILWVTAQLKTDFYSISIEKMMMTCNHGSKTLIKKSFLSLLLWWEYAKDEDGEMKPLGFRGKINKCRSGGLGKIYEIKQNYDYCALIASDSEIGNNEEIGF